MKANELRIGNLILLGEYICEIRGIKEDICLIKHPESYTQSGVISAKLETLIPILITKERLFNLGFKEDDGFFHKDGFWLTPDLCLDGVDPFKPIKYVHQLQNLYFAIKGEELKLTKPSKSEK